MDLAKARGTWSKALLVFAVCAAGALAFAQEGRKVLVHPQPAYPDIARELSLKGNVRVEILIGADGEIKSTKVIGGHPILVQAALDALKKWKYAPATTETTTTLEFAFH